MKIAVLDDDAEQAELICRTLAADGLHCHACSSGQELLSQLRREPVDLLVIAWHIADRSGAEVLGWMRTRLAPNLPVLLLASSAHPDDIDAGLAAGANDYQLMPLRRGELRARVQTLLRRAYPHQEALPQRVFGSYAFVAATARLTRDGLPVELTRKEFDLALMLFQHLGLPLSRTTILEAVWGRDIDIPSRTMDTHISRIRNKLALRPENGFRLAPVYSYGYCLEEISRPTE
jgi:DNA-binding response OmpR family regulator